MDSAARPRTRGPRQNLRKPQLPPIAADVATRPTRTFDRIVKKLKKRSSTMPWLSDHIDSQYCNMSAGHATAATTMANRLEMAAVRGDMVRPLTGARRCSSDRDPESHGPDRSRRGRSYGRPT